MTNASHFGSGSAFDPPALGCNRDRLLAGNNTKLHESNSSFPPVAKRLSGEEPAPDLIGGGSRRRRETEGGRAANAARKGSASQQLDLYAPLMRCGHHPSRFACHPLIRFADRGKDES